MDPPVWGIVHLTGHEWVVLGIGVGHDYFFTLYSMCDRTHCARHPPRPFESKIKQTSASDERGSRPCTRRLPDLLPPELMHLSSR